MKEKVSTWSVLPPTKRCTIKMGGGGEEKAIASGGEAKTSMIEVPGNKSSVSEQNTPKIDSAAKNSQGAEGITGSPLQEAISWLRVSTESTVHLANQSIIDTENAFHDAYSANLQPTVQRAWKEYKDYRRMYPVQIISGVTLTGGILGLPCKLIPR